MTMERATRIAVTLEDGTTHTFEGIGWADICTTYKKVETPHEDPNKPNRVHNEDLGAVTVHLSVPPNRAKAWVRHRTREQMNKDPESAKSLVRAAQADGLPAQPESWEH